MKKLLFYSSALAVFLGINQNAQAQDFTQNFSGGIPANWVTVNDGNTPSTTLLTPAAQAKMVAKGWDISAVKGSSDPCAFTISCFTPTATADRWLITHAFTPGADRYITWQDFSIDSPEDSIEVWVSPTAGTTPASFTTKIYAGPAKDANSFPFMSHAASLAAYNGQSIRVGFRQHSTNKLLLYLDDVAVKALPAVDLQVTAVSPDATSPLAYGKVGTNVNFRANVQNNGGNPVTSYTINYQQGSNPIVTQNVNVAVPALGYATVNLTTPFNIAATNNYPVRIWVKANNDNVNNNDTGKTTVVGVDAALWPSKKMVFEEGTGTWCQWCPRGAVFMDSLRKLTIGATQIAVHNSSSDPMQLPAYDQFISANIGGYPSMLADRRLEIDPSEMIGIYNQQKDYFGFANMSIAPTATASSATVPVTIKPAVDLSGDFRLVLVVTEDHVKGTTSGYAQANAYSNYANMSVNGVNFRNLPNPVPASQMEYNFTARSVTPSPTGTANMLPASMTKGNTYNYTFSNVALNSNWTAKYLRYNVLMINGASGIIMNSASTVWGLDVKDLGETLDNVSLFPNPATADAYLTFNVKTASDIQINVVNQMGQVSKVIMTSTKLSGAQKVQISTADLAAGNYLVNIVTAEGTNSQKLTVVK